MLTGWATDQSNHGSIFVYLLGEIKSHFGLDGILPIKNSSLPRFIDMSWYIK